MTTSQVETGAGGGRQGWKFGPIGRSDNIGVLLLDDLIVLVKLDDFNSS